MKTPISRLFILAVLACAALAASVPVLAHDGYWRGRAYGYVHYGYGPRFYHPPRVVIVPRPVVVYPPAYYAPPAPVYYSAPAPAYYAPPAYAPAPALSTIGGAI